MNKSTRSFVAVAGSILMGSACCWYLMPLFEESPILTVISVRGLWVYLVIKYSTQLILYTTPYLLLGWLLEQFRGKEKENLLAKLPVYVEPEQREELYLTLGEIHNERTEGPHPVPRWANWPEGGMVTGMAVIGAQGSGKTTGLMYPVIRQLFSTWAGDPERKIGGLILEVKGDLCYEAQKVLAAVNRSDDYIELGLESGWSYNPLASELDPYALASAVGSLIVNVFGKSLEPFWQMAYTNIVKYIILLYRLSDGYVTFVDIYRAILKPELICEKIETAQRNIEGQRFYEFSKDTFRPYAKPLAAKGARFDRKRDVYVAPWSQDLEAYVTKRNLPHDTSYIGPDVPDVVKKHMLQAVMTWYFDDFLHLDPKTRMNIAESITVFLSLFDSDYELHRAFCPSREEHETGVRILRGFREQIETGKVVAVNFPASINAAIAKIIATLIKLDYERAVINRIPEIVRHPEKYWRHTAMIADEYHVVATAGERDPEGDDKFFSLARQPKCIPIIAMQSISSLRTALPGESWRTVLQLFRSKMFLSQTDIMSAKEASDLCGTEEQLKEGYSLTESAQDAKFTIDKNLKTKKGGASLGKSYTSREEPRFRIRDFTELPNYEAIAMIFDGRKPLPPMRLYLKPAHVDRSLSYFEQKAQNLV